MAFTKTSFQPAGGQAKANVAPQLHTYKTEDGATDVRDSGYFDAIADVVRVGDVIIRVTVDGDGVVQSAGMHVVLSNSGGVVDVSDETALTTTNT
ncbi:MAG: hypothetical protein ACOCUS_02205 [Polyangiales bacterium]